jgi:hypothetical protein
MDFEEIQKALNLARQTGIHVQGDLVMKKEVQYEVNNVEAGGIGIQVQNGANASVEKPPTDEENEIVAELKTIFWGDEEEATKFLHNIQNMKSKEITQLVKKLVEEKKISDKSCNRPLWTILNKYNLYTATESNWNSQV